MQQIPRRGDIRKFICAPPGYKLITADYSQIELVIVAQITQDPNLLYAYRNNVDVHRLTASFLLGKPVEEITKEERQLAKAVNFGLIYGMGAEKLQLYAATSYGVFISLEESIHYRGRWHERYHYVGEWHRRSSRELRDPECIELGAITLGGRRRQFEQFAGGRRTQFTRYVNTQDQGTGGDIYKLAIYMLYESFRGLDMYPIMQVHDEYVCEVPEDNAEKGMEITVKCMVDAGEYYLPDVPVVVEASINQRWSK
jgi:DNA polymerase-1